MSDCLHLHPLVFNKEDHFYSSFIHFYSIDKDNIQDDAVGLTYSRF